MIIEKVDTGPAYARVKMGDTCLVYMITEKVDTG